MIRVLVNDWMTSMGAVALMRLDPDGKYVQADGNCIEFTVNWLEGLPERLFHFIVTHYSVANREFEVMKSIASRLEKNANDSSKYKENKKWINDRIKNNIDRVKRYFPEFNDDCQQISDGIKQAIDTKDFGTLDQHISQMYKLLKLEVVDQKLTMNWAKATILGQVAGQASFLNVAKNSLAFSEQMALFEKDYVTPLLWELQLRKFFNDRDESAIEELFEQDSIPNFASSWKREKKRSKLSWCEWLSQLPECALIEDQWGTISFEEMHFLPLGMSISNAYNYTWDGNLNASPPISSLAKLLFFLSSLGCISYRRPYKGEEVNVFGFLHYESSCEHTFFLNEQLASAMRQDVIFSDALRDSFMKLRELERRRQEAAVLIEWFSEYTAKKTILDYKPLNPNFIKYLLSDHSEITSRIFPYSFREEIVRAALDNVDSKHLIFNEMRNVINQPLSLRMTYSLRNALLMREYLIELKEEIEMDRENSVTDQMYKLGFRIARKLAGNGSDQESEGVPYRASGEKKMTAVAYRLMNAAKAGNRELFYDTAFRLHIAAGVKISSTFTAGLDPNTSDRDFATIALAFVAGLIPAEQRNNTLEMDESILHKV